MPAPPALDSEPAAAAEPLELPAEREQLPAERVEEPVPPPAEAPDADVFE
jgi:hypothetical protein